MLQSIFKKLCICIVGFSFVTSQSVENRTDSELEYRPRIRALFLNCERNIPKTSDKPGCGELEPFEVEELYQHNAITDCRKKLTLTMRLTSNPKDFGEEFLPIDHVIDPSTKQKLRLLNPYVVKLLQELPVQAYNLTLLDTIDGEIINDAGDDILNLVSNEPSECSTEMNTKKKKRDASNCSKHVWHPDQLDFTLQADVRRGSAPEPIIYRTDEEGKQNFDESLIVNSNLSDLMPTDQFQESQSVEEIEKQLAKVTQNIEAIANEDHPRTRSFHVYSIDEPELWHSVTIQLFEKLTTSDGNTAWRDVTKGRPLSIGSTKTSRTDSSPPSVALRYRSDGTIKTNEYELSSPSDLYILVPKPTYSPEIFSDAGDPDSLLIVPTNEILIYSDGKSDDRYKEKRKDVPPHSEKKQRIVIHGPRKLRECVKPGISAEVKIVDDGEKSRFLVLPHMHPHHCQVDLEALADHNQVVKIGSSGRLTKMAVDSTRPDRSVVTIHATNTGLAAARLRVLLSDCDQITEGSSITSDAIVIPPWHTRKIRLVVPNSSLTHRLARCSVRLINDNNDVAAIRDISIKTGDRCFCVWHCKCTCLSTSPNLLCEDMDPAQQAAAGLVNMDGNVNPVYRQRRNYKDCQIVNILIFLFALFLFLFMLGIIKAIIGCIIPVIGRFGMKLIVGHYKLTQYFEKDLRDRPVVYDDDGYPIHPDTNKRNVRIMPRWKEFFLNLAFFLVTPYLVTYRMLRQIIVYMCPCKCIKSKREPTSVYAWTQNAHLNTYYPNETQYLLTESRYMGDCCDDTTEASDTKYVIMQMQKSKESLSRTKCAEGSNENSPRRPIAERD